MFFFGEQLPRRFHEKCEAIAKTDLVLGMGSSLLVAPFKDLPSMVKEKTPRVLFDMERVGDLGSRADDVVVLGGCDAGVRKIAEALGWAEELEVLAVRLRTAAGGENALESEVDKIARDLGASLIVSDKEEGGGNLADDPVERKENEASLSRPSMNPSHIPLIGGTS